MTTAENAKPGDDPDNGKKASSDPLAAGADRLREAVKWLLAGFGAIGASLALGSQIAGIGDLGGWRLAVAIVAGLLAFAGVIAALGFTVRVLTGSYISFGQLAGESKEQHQKGNARTGLVEFFEVENPQYLGTHKTLTALQKAYLEAFRTGSDLREPLARQVEYLLEAASFERIRRNFNEKLPWILASISVTAVAVVAFTWAANPPEEDSTTQAVVASEPSLVNLSLDRKTIGLLRNELGEDCKLSDVPAFALTIDNENVTVLTLPTETCSVTKFEMTPNMGVITAGTHTCTTAAESPGFTQPTSTSPEAGSSTQPTTTQPTFVKCGGIAAK